MKKVFIVIGTGVAFWIINGIYLSSIGVYGSSKYNTLAFFLGIALSTIGCIIYSNIPSVKARKEAEREAELAEKKRLEEYRNSPEYKERKAARELERKIELAKLKSINETFDSYRSHDSFSVPNNVEQPYYTPTIRSTAKGDYHKAVHRLHSAKLQNNPIEIANANAEVQRTLMRCMNEGINVDKDRYNTAVQNLQVAKIQNINPNSGNRTSEIMAEMDLLHSLVK